MDDPLFNTLLEREQQDPAPKPVGDPTVEKALDLLQPEKRPVYRKIQWKGAGRGPDEGLQARVDHSDPEKAIQVADWTKQYRNATKGNPEALRNLAAVLAHEMYHQSSGEDENAAYDAQLNALRRLGATEKEISRILAAKALVAQQMATVPAKPVPK